LGSSLIVVAGVIGFQKYILVFRLHKLLYDAFMQLTWKGFPSWFESNHSDDVVHLEDTLKVVNGLLKDISPADVHEMRANQSCVHIFKAV
jgi:hypothetical protein